MKTFNTRKWGTSPHNISKYDIQKTRDMSTYLDNDAPMQSDKLKIRLIKEGYLKPECYKCGREEWEGEEIALQLNHKDGDKDNNSLRNLELLCPNCHAMTEHWKVKDEFKESSPANAGKKDSNTDT